ncbi:hypothetical protein ACFW04_011327 [Cataglyphis niger]
MNLLMMQLNNNQRRIFDKITASISSNDNNEMDCDKGWSGKKHIHLFGDLLQLLPVHEGPPFIELSKLKIEKYIEKLIMTAEKNHVKSNYLQSLPMDTVYLLLTCALHDILNTIELIAQDLAECASYLNKKVMKILSKNDKDSLVNSMIGIITSIMRNAINNNHIIERLSVKFEVIDRAYDMTIHKNQGLSLKYAIIEAGNSIFSCGQIYVAFSHPNLLNINILKQCIRKVRDTTWAVSKNVLECHVTVNVDNISCYVNVSLQCIFHSYTLRKLLLRLERINIVSRVP